MDAKHPRCFFVAPQPGSLPMSHWFLATQGPPRGSRDLGPQEHNAWSTATPQDSPRHPKTQQIMKAHTTRVWRYGYCLLILLTCQSFLSFMSCEMMWDTEWDERYRLINPTRRDNEGTLCRLSTCFDYSWLFMVPARNYCRIHVYMSHIYI